MTSLIGPVRMRATVLTETHAPSCWMKDGCRTTGTNADTSLEGGVARQDWYLQCLMWRVPLPKAQP